MFYRFRVANEDEPEYYKKRKGTTGIKGYAFEFKLCGLAYLRAKEKWRKFKLASNVDGHGAFDDILIEYINSKSSLSHIFVQLKSTKSERITLGKLKGNNKDFGLNKYYESYIDIEEKFNRTGESVKIDSGIDGRMFILYSNADIGHDVKSNKNIDVGEADFLLTGGSVLQFSKKKHKAIYEHLQNLPKYREFLRRFRIFYNQADEERMDSHIKPELQSIMNVSENILDLVYPCFIDFMKDWWQKYNYFLKDNCKDEDPWLKTVKKVMTSVKNILDQRKSDLDDLSIKYKESAIREMEKLIKPHKAVLILAPGRTTTLTAAKIHQTLGATEHIILNLQQFVRCRSEVTLAWKNIVEVLVLEGGSSGEDFQDIFREISDILNKTSAERKFIFITNSIDNREQISAFQSLFRTNFTQKQENWKLRDITTPSMRIILEKNVTFHGTKIQIEHLVKENDLRRLNALDCDSVSLLLGNKKPSIGTPIGNPPEYYIARTLEKVTNIKCGIHTDSELLSTRTLLESKEQIILVTDEPGMGKSTLLTHLEKEIRECRPDIWTVKVNINKYVSILQGIEASGFVKEDALRLLTEAAEIKETEGSQLEKQLFNHVYSCTRNMVVLIDGVDEVSPHYSEIFIEILRTLSQGKIRRIWVTSRNSMKDQLEEEFQCQSYSLIPFSVPDQKSFLVKFWNQTNTNTTARVLENLAQQVVELSRNNLCSGHKDFMGVPFQSKLLARIFEKYIHETVLPQNVNCLHVCESYVNEKWNIYVTEKKDSHKANVSVRIDDDALHEIFIEKHKAAALMATLSTHHLEKINDMKIKKMGADFLQRIKQGLEKTGIIIDIIEKQPVFQSHILAEYFVAVWLCDNVQASQTFMREHLLESRFDVVRGMVDRILAGKRTIHEAVLNLNMQDVARLLKRRGTVTHKDGGGRTPLHVAISCRNTELIRLLLEHGADRSSVDTLLRYSPVEYATGMDDGEVLRLLME